MRSKTTRQDELLAIVVASILFYEDMSRDEDISRDEARAKSGAVCGPSQHVRARRGEKMGWRPAFSHLASTRTNVVANS